MDLRAQQDVVLRDKDDDAVVATAVWKDAHWPVKGVVLEGAWSHGDELLVATTDDTPYEDMLHLALLSPDGRVADGCDIGGIYATGTFEFLNVTGPALQFRFINEMDWTVEILRQPALRVPFLGDPVGVKRGLRLSTRLKITATPTLA